MDSTIAFRMAEAMREMKSANAEAYAHELAATALDRLMTLRPDVAALLRGEAVAVPRFAIEAAEEAMSTLLNTCTVIVGKYPDDGNIYEHEKWAEEELEKARADLRAMLAASPFAMEKPE